MYAPLRKKLRNMRVNLVLDLVDASLELVDGPALLYLPAAAR